MIPAGVAEEAKSILETVVSSGTGTHADIGASGQWGKTGTTENSGDAWFCGGTEEVTACVWVGYADTTTPMTTLYNGGPVHGRHLPGPDLGRRDLRLAGNQGRTGGGSEGTQGRRGTRKGRIHGRLDLHCA